LRQRRGLKNPWAREEDVFLVHPQNGLNGLILNWCMAAGSFQPFVTTVVIINNFLNAFRTLIISFVWSSVAVHNALWNAFRAL
jgi:hypothetical protein